MPHPLDVRIGALRRKARRLLLLHGISCAVGVAVAAVALAALGDYLLRYEETGIRVASTAAVLLVAAGGIWRYFLPAYRAELSDIFLARRIESKFPLLKERLAGSVAFLHARDDDPSAGSAELRRATIHATTQDALRLPLSSVVHVRPILAGVSAALLVATAAMAVAVARPATTRIAMNRLFRPWGDDLWPQKNHLKVVDPVKRIASGHRFRAEVVDADRAEIDGDVTILYRRNADDKNPEQSVMRFESGKWAIEREDIRQDFSYRAIGGDDRSMPWIDVQVVEPPTVQEVSWTVTYPAYVHWNKLETGKLSADRPSLTNPLPADSIVELHARSSKPISSAVMHVDGRPDLRATIDADRLNFSFTLAAGNALKVEKSESLRFKLDGDDGLGGGDEMRQELLVEADPPPWVKLLKPQGSPEDPRGDILITPTARLDVEVQAGDAFTVRPQVALRSIELRYSRSDHSSDGDQSIPLHSGPATLTPAAIDAPTHLKDEELRTVEHQWDLKALDLKPGTFVTVFAAATDYKLQERISESRRLRVVSPDEFLERMNERQRALHAELNRVRAKQSSARTQTTEAAEASSTKPTDDPKQEESLRRKLTDALDRQREIAAALGLERSTTSTIDPNRKAAEGREGVRGRVDSMLADLKANRIDNREVESRLTDIAARLDDVERETKPQEIADKLAEALKIDRRDEAQRAEATAALQTAGERQQDLMSALDAMLRNLTQWDDYGKFHEELARIKREQEQVAGETTEHLQKQLKNEGKPNETAQQRREAADRKREELAARQAALSRRFEQLQQNMKRNAAADAARTNEALHRAVEAAEKSNPSGAMRDAGQMLRDDQAGKAPARQQEALGKLGRVMQALSAQKVDELNRLVSKLKKAESELADVAKEQQGLKKKFRDASRIADEKERQAELKRLAKKQRELQEKNAKLVEELKRLRADRAVAKLQQGGGKMDGAGQGAEQGDSAQAEEQSASAERDLENARQELAQERRQAEKDLAQEIAAKLEDDVKAQIERQRRIVGEVARYETLRNNSGLTRAALVGLIDLAEEQTSLEQEVCAAAERLGAAPAFKHGLEGSARDMARTAELVRERKTDAPTQQVADSAVRRLQHLLAALKPRKSDNPGGDQGGGGEGQGGGEQGGGQTPTSLAELVLIKLLQEDVNARTKELDLLRKRGKLTPEESQEFTRLGEEQGRLAELLLDLIGEPTTDDAATPADDAAKPADGAEPLKSDDAISDVGKPGDNKPGGDKPAESDRPATKKPNPRTDPPSGETS